MTLNLIQDIHSIRDRVQQNHSQAYGKLESVFSAVRTLVEASAPTRTIEVNAKQKRAFDMSDVLQRLGKAQQQAQAVLHACQEVTFQEAAAHSRPSEQRKQISKATSGQQTEQTAPTSSNKPPPANKTPRGNDAMSTTTTTDVHSPAPPTYTANGNSSTLPDHLRLSIQSMPSESTSEVMQRATPRTAVELQEAARAIAAAKAEALNKSTECDVLKAQLHTAQQQLKQLSQLVENAATQGVAEAVSARKGQDYRELLELQGLCSSVRMRSSCPEAVQQFALQGGKIDAMLEAALSRVRDLKADLMEEEDPPVTPGTFDTAQRSISTSAPTSPPNWTNAPPNDAYPTTHPTPIPAANGHSHPSDESAAPPNPSPASPFQQPSAIPPLEQLQESPVIPEVPKQPPVLPPGVPPFEALPDNLQELYYFDEVEFFRIISEFTAMLQG